MNPNEPVDPGTGVRYHPGSMELNQRILRCAGNFRAVPCAVLAVVALLLVVVPFLDLAWNHASPDDAQGIRCQLHANPVVTLVPGSPLIPGSPELLLASRPPAKSPLLAPSIFVPPRA